MRQDEQQSTTDHPEVVRSTPVAVPPPDAVDADPVGRHATARDDRDRDGVDDRAAIDHDDDGIDGDGFDDRDGFDNHDGYYGPRNDDGLPLGRPRSRDDADRETPAGTDPDGDRRPEFHEPAPLPTAFGATSVGDAVAASALAGGRPQDERDARDEDLAAPGDGAPGRTGPFDDERADPTGADRIHDRDRWSADRTSDDHRTGTDDIDAGDVNAGDVDATDPDRDADRPAPVTDAAGYGSATPAMVDPDATADGDGSTAAGVVAAGTAGATGAAAAAAGADAERSTGANVPSDAATLFEADAAQGFRDRWRDVQLRFVDDPRGAAGEAQSLVEEAIAALSEALAAQKEKLGGWQGADEADTEQLRVAVRRYRDFLDRVLGR
ncbi:hypothetical protein B5D80_05890 [Micromonospora wenchangensis]|uniref:Uncharacterized protein n=1 Tax=Micromonospora wenchangensis TaxID=1185415 RepID=A0A246RR86_9ACTN|nr:hypothetical protein [Micromonospora wenchangensis]OWV10768.1 hypothetical protein B5D80_05890 [Micromonospora wenchangensis]